MRWDIPATDVGTGRSSSAAIATLLVAEVGRHISTSRSRCWSGGRCATGIRHGFLEGLHCKRRPRVLLRRALGNGWSNRDAAFLLLGGFFRSGLLCCLESLLLLRLFLDLLTGITTKRTLLLALKIHLAPHIHLEGLDISLVGLHFFVITNPDFFCHLTNKSHVVTNKHYAALEVINGVGESVNGLHVEMVRRLVKKQNMRNLASQLGKYDPRLLPIAQLIHLLDLHLARDTESAQVLPLFVIGSSRIKLVEVLKRSKLDIQNVDEVLSEPTKLQVTVRTNVAEGRLELTSH
mmetsp:Transcript_24393/g.70203  ORF Transcript_24393/g.70203 Transcript_24393/m.70203 type:complete len:292 (+) Transcript_24393:265-1140(+)